MKELIFLVIGKNDEILVVLERVIQSNENWKAIITNNMEKFYDILSKIKVDIVLLSSGLDKKTEDEIKNYIFLHKPESKVIEHFGGGSGLLKNEVLIEFPNLNYI